MSNNTALAALLTAAVLWLRRYVVLTPQQADACALWAAHTHAIEAFKITPYLSVSSAVKRSGKTRLMETLRPLVANPVDVDGITPAALVRLVDKDRPTLLLDESDASFNGSTELAEALRGILNSGFRSRGKFIKCVGDKHQLKTFSTFGAKAISGIGKLPDTVADRSIPIRLRRRAPGEAVAEFSEEDWEFQARPIAHGFADALTSLIEELQAAAPSRPDGISDRAKDAWKPLLAVADVAGGDWPDHALDAARVLSASADVDEQEIAIRLMAALRDAFEERDADRLTSEDVRNYLLVREDEPWGDWSRGNPISHRRIAELLRPFEIKPRVIRVGDSTPRGYDLGRCQDAFARYLPASNRNIRNNGSSKPDSGVSPSATRPPMLRIESGHKPHDQADVALVADSQVEMLGVSLYDEEPLG